MRVAMVSEHASPLATLGGVDAGGQNVHVAALATSLARRGVDVVVHTRRDRPGLPDRAPLAPGVVVEHVTAGPAAPIAKDDLLPYMDEFGAQLRSAWERERPDVVHSHFWMSGRAALAAAVGLALPVAHTFHALGVVKRRHQGDQDTSPGQRLRTERVILATADRIIATCRDEAAELDRLGADSQRVSIVPSGVDLDAFCPRGPAEPRRRGLQRLVVVSRLVPRKGVANVVAALPALPATELVVAGGPDFDELDRDPEAARLRAMAARHGVGDRLVLRGRVDRQDMPALLRSADVVVCAPWYEPFGIVALEAMACGVPVVATAVGGQLDTVVHGVNGLLVPPRHPASLVEALGSLLADPPRRSALGRAGRSLALRRYGWGRVAIDTLNVYEQLAQQAQTAPVAKALP